MTWIKGEKKPVGKYAGENNGQAKLTEAQVREIKTLLLSGVDLTALSKKFGIHRHQIWAISAGKCWSHVK